MFVVLALVGWFAVAPGSAVAQVTDPQQWVGEWKGTLTSRVDESCGEGGRYKVSKQKVRFRITLDEDGKVRVWSAGGAMPLTLAEGAYAANSEADGLLLRDEPPVTVRLSRRGLSLLYSGELQTRCGGLEGGTLVKHGSTGVAECDNLIAIHMSAGWCAAFPQDSRPGFPNAGVVRKLKGTARARQQQACAEAVQRTWRLMVTSGCFKPVGD